MLNRVIIMGRLCADPEFRQTTSGIPVCRFRVAVNRPKKQDGSQEADFIGCTAWRSTAEFITRYFGKGQMILVEGSLRNNDYTDNNGVKHYSMDVLVAQVQFGESKKQDDAPQQTQPRQQTAHKQQPAPQPAATQPQLDLAEFEEIISGGEIPF